MKGSFEGVPDRKTLMPKPKTKVRSVTPFIIKGGSKYKAMYSAQNGARRFEGPYEWQAEGYKALKSRSLRLLAAPTGCGKSTLLRAYGLNDLKRRACTRVIACVPQQVIGNGWKDVRIQLPGTDKVVEWSPGHDLIGVTGTIEKLISFLAQPQRTTKKRILLCTHATLVHAFKRLRDEGRQDLLKKVGLIIDETHHSKSPKDINSEEDVTIFNGLGEVVYYWLKNDVGPLTLATATMFRADWFPLIPNEWRDKFSTYQLAIEDYLAQCLPKGFEANVRFFVGNPEKAITQILAEDPAKKTLVYLPYTEHPYVRKVGGKIKLLDRLKKRIGRTIRKGFFETRKFGGSELSVADLVTVEGREHIRNYLLNEITKDGAHKEAAADLPNIIFALGMCKEGFDYPALERSVVIGERGSIPELLQMLGRLLRRYPNKKHVEFNIVLPFETEVEDVQKYLNVMVSSFVVEWHFLGELPCGVEKLRKMTEEATRRAVEAVSGADSRDLIASVVDTVDPKASPKEKKKLAKFLLRGFSASSRRLMALEGQVPAEFNVNLVEHAFASVRIISGAFGCSTIRELREMVGRLPTITVQYVAQKIVLFRCREFADKGDYRDPMTIPGIPKLFGPNAEQEIRAEGFGPYGLLN